MGGDVIAVTLAGHLVTSARVTLPAWGAWYADVSIAGEETLTGALELKLGDLTLKGTVLSGGPAAGRSHYRLVAGAGGWGRALPKKSYASDAGVKLATVLADAAREAGEQLGPLPTSSVGPGFTRREGPAARVLERLAPSAWYIGEDGVTRLGSRPTTTLDAKVPRVTPVDRARGMVTLAPQAVANILPGVVVDGLEAVDVLHEVSAEGGLRTTIWGKQGAGSSRRLSALRKILEQLDPDRPYRGVTEYRVVTLDGKRVNLQPVRVSSGMPDLRRVTMRPGVSGCDSNIKLASRVLVGFVDSDGTRPFIAAFEDAEGDGFLPTQTRVDASVSVEIGKTAALTKLGDGLLPVARGTDMAGPFPIVPTQVKVLS